jgi:hypothetical protein
MEKVSAIAEMSRSFEDGVALGHARKKQAAKSLLNNAGIFFSVFLLFVVVIIVTTDISFASPEEWVGLGRDFFLLLACTYTMYINCSDSGMRYGLRTDAYLDAVENFDNRKNRIIKDKNQTRLHEFCRHYIEEELQQSKMEELAVVGFSYKDYIDNWLGCDDEKVNEDKALSKAQKKAIIKANAIKPIRLTPEMILQRARSKSRRSPLGLDPKTKKKINYAIKLVTNLFIAIFLTGIVIKMIIEPTWIMLADGTLKLIAVIFNGYTGYKYGYENIVFDTTNYMNDQTDLMDQAIEYFERDEDKIDGN